MKLAIFGATGKTGLAIVEDALATRHEVTAFVRDPSRLTVKHERLAVAQGEALDAAGVEEAARG